MSSVRGLVIGIDGGGTSTRAVLAERNGGIIGRGEAGPGNPKSAGLDASLVEVGRAIEAAFAAAQTKIETVEAICLALAGAGRPEDRPPIQSWILNERIAVKAAVVPDALAVLAAAATNVVGISLIAGTGSMAFGRDDAGGQARAGGWGSLFGDEGSGYALAIAGLRAAVRALDGRGPSTTLLPMFLDRLKLTEAGGLVTTLYSSGWDKRRLSSLAAVVTHCVDQGDDVAKGLLLESVNELTCAALAVARRLEWDLPPSVALTGGLVVHSPVFRSTLEQSLAGAGEFRDAKLVTEPAIGSVAVARRIADGEEW